MEGGKVSVSPQVCSVVSVFIFREEAPGMKQPQGPSGREDPGGHLSVTELLLSLPLGQISHSPWVIFV